MPSGYTEVKRAVADEMEDYILSEQDGWKDDTISWKSGVTQSEKNAFSSYFQSNGKIKKQFCDKYGTNNIKECKDSLKKIKKLGDRHSQLTLIAENLEEHKESLEDEQFNRDIGLSDEKDTEASGLCFDCLDELRELDKPTDGQVFGNVLSVVAGGALSYFGYRAGKRDARYLNDLRLRQGYAPISSAGPAWAGASVGVPFMANGIYGLAGGHSQFGHWACSPGFAGGAAGAYSPFAHYGLNAYARMGGHGGFPYGPGFGGGFAAGGGLPYGPGFGGGFAMGGGLPYGPGFGGGFAMGGGLPYGPGFGGGFAAGGGLPYGPGFGGGFAMGGGLPYGPGFGGGFAMGGGLPYGPGFGGGFAMGGGLPYGPGFGGGFPYGPGAFPMMNPGINLQAQYQQQQYQQHFQFQQQQMQARLQAQQAWLQHQQSIQRDWMQRQQVIGSLTQELFKIQQQIQLVASGGISSSGITAIGGTASTGAGSVGGVTSPTVPGGNAPVHQPSPQSPSNNTDGNVPVIIER